MRLWQLQVACGLAFHAEDMKARLKEKLETLELDDLPGVHGLRALRVTVDQSSGALAEWAMRHGDLHATTEPSPADASADSQFVEAPETPRAVAL